MTYKLSHGSIYDSSGLIIENPGFILTIDKADPNMVLVNAVGDYDAIANTRLARLQPMAHLVDIICFGFTPTDQNGLQLSKEDQVAILNHIIHVTGSPKIKDIAQAIRDEDRDRLEKAFKSII